jgi:nucleotide-sensitive chloride channel 1A
LSWVAEGGLGFSVEYIAISIHAISKDRNVFPNDCLYLQLSCKLDSDEENSTSEEDEVDEYPVTEVRFVPQDPTKCKYEIETAIELQMKKTLKF